MRPKLGQGGRSAPPRVWGRQLAYAPPCLDARHPAAEEVADFHRPAAATRPRLDAARCWPGIVGSTGGERIGWHDAEHFHFLPKVAYHTVAAFAREEGHYFGPKERALRDALAEEGLLAAGDGRHTIMLRVGKETHRVMRVRRAAFEKLWGSN